ncbi:LacI family DNA-binding transcriptional regulator [Aquamicrobium zhengzhouense]|uniref:LacI family DNA-binding transcriptional regulator n=1 Tax=Aquamicrobium zhengzhouense TaxID=2781738 RepID=A0ABS0SC14_9HYPH|nr:LacI family DNA-binding transcriptional regulator [Aquamicrobium zhengzhouense]MBI1620849.1 LacI family DNA-binding transcriptional regulator [Aquamicrobium zhengzhouense]
MNSRPKIKDIAERAGVSPATVSRALSGSGLVAEPTLSRIRETARAMNYRPNVSARNLRTQRSMSVLMVVRDISNPFYLEVMKGVEEAASDAGYSVLMGNTQNNPRRETEYFDMLRDGHADGMILMTGKLPPRLESEGSALSQLPLVVALETIEGYGLPHVQIDNRGASREAVEHLIGLGHRRIAHLTGPLPELMATLRRDGWREAMQAAGLDIPAAYEQRGDYLLRTGQELTAKLWELPEPPTAIFCANDEMAFGAIHELRRRGLDVPADVSVVGFDDIYLSQALFPPLTTVSQPRAEIGRKAMSLLLDVIGEADLPPDPVVMPTILKIRGTTGPVREN